MSMPGAFDSEPDTDTERATLVERFDVEDSSMDEDFSLSTDDDDASAIYYGEDGEEDEGLAALNEAADAEIERGFAAPDADEEAEEEEEEDATDPSQQLRIAYDASTRTIMVVSASGQTSRLRSSHLRGSTLTLSSIRRMLTARFGINGAQNEEGEEDESEEDEDEDDDYGMGWGVTKRNRKLWYEVVTEPQPAGLKLLRSGDFAAPPPKLVASDRKFTTFSSNLASTLRTREYDYRAPKKVSINEGFVPNSAGVVTSEFQSKVYCGQYSEDGKFFYAATQAFKVYLFDTSKAPATGSKSITDNTVEPTASRRSMRDNYWEHRSSMSTSKIYNANDLNCRWTITDANLSPDNTLLIYSSITPRVHLVRTQGAGVDDDQITLDLAAGRGSREFGIWSLRFSNDAREIVAGGTEGAMCVYDIESRRTVLRVGAHEADVNAVAFADKASSNLLLSGSDDQYIKMWDRRSMSAGRASSTLVGHTEGITFLAAKGDGRYVVSNGKDQTMRLWDLRNASDAADERVRLDRKDYGIPGWDYRQSYYAKPKYTEHPHDSSVMRFRGHAVLRTLIRCNFSPLSTNQQYVYSGSSDGKVHIWSLDGRVVQTIDRRYTHPLINAAGEYNDPSDVSLRTSVYRPGKSSYSSTIRDVAWHPSEPSLMSTAWEGRGGVEGSLAKHEWGSSNETLEDQAARQIQEASG